jgi:hypothetical protein
VVTVVSGSELDRLYWQEHFNKTLRDVFRRDGATAIVSVAETVRKGNFLGMLNAWVETQQVLENQGIALPSVCLMSMVFGKGKRLSPFTQTLGDRKAAFPTPRFAPTAHTYLRMADLSNLTANLMATHLEQHGFHGCVVKWGDEAIVPGIRWDSLDSNYADVDAVRFVSETNITEDLAREKEWIATSKTTGLMKHQFARQEAAALKQRVAQHYGEECSLGVNLGSLAISYEFLNTAVELLKPDIIDKNLWVDWDPYVWIALFCRDRSQWEAEIEYEELGGRRAMRELEIRYPHFYEKITAVRRTLEEKMRRPLRVATLDFGQPLWTDFGLHKTLRTSLETLTENSEIGEVMRNLFTIPQSRDRNGNILIDSRIPPGADIKDSVIIGSVILDASSLIHSATVIGGRHRCLRAPVGGSALFCAADLMVFQGEHGVALRSIGQEVVIPAGGRHTSLLLPSKTLDMVSHESIFDYSGDNYSRPILSNAISFEEAGDLMSQTDGQELEERWFHIWSNWLM